MTIAAYVVTLLLALFGVVSILGPVLAGVFVRVTGHPSGLLLGLLAGAWTGWLILDRVWRMVEGGPIPLAALAACFVAMGLHASAEREALEPMAKRVIGADMTAIVLLAIILALAPGPMRLY